MAQHLPGTHHRKTGMMPTIRFNFELKPLFNKAYEEWRRQLPREPGQLGGTQTMTIEGPGPVVWPGGGDPNCSITIPTDFLAYLRQHYPGLTLEEQS
jgi:hypothetical protein